MSALVRGAIESAGLSEIALARQHGTFNNALKLAFRKYEVVGSNLGFSCEINDGSQRSVFGSGIVPAGIRSVPRCCVIQVDSQMILPRPGDPNLVVAIRPCHHSIAGRVLRRAVIYFDTRGRLSTFHCDAAHQPEPAE